MEKHRRNQSVLHCGSTARSQLEKSKKKEREREMCQELIVTADNDEKSPIHSSQRMPSAGHSKTNLYKVMSLPLLTFNLVTVFRINGLAILISSFSYHKTLWLHSTNFVKLSLQTGFSFRNDFESFFHLLYFSFDYKVCAASLASDNQNEQISIECNV